jgi:hypothetical protein
MKLLRMFSRLSKDLMRFVVALFVCLFNTHVIQMCRWVQTEILDADTPVARATRITSFIRVTEMLYKTRNLNGLHAIMTGLNSTSVKRLRESWPVSTKVI